MAVSEADLKALKRRLDKELRHVKTILAQERHRLPMRDWLRLVQATKESIIRAPDDFFCSELPARSVLVAAIEKIFESFIEDQRLLSLQKSNIWWTPER